MTNEIKTTSNLLFKEEPLVVNRLAAKVLGLNEAIVIQQIHYWLEINRKAQINFNDGRTWTYNTYEDWQKNNFDFWSLSTLKRVFKNLFDKGILIKSNYNLHKYDRKLWVSIDYNKLDLLLDEYNCKNTQNVEISTECQNDTMSNSNIVSKWNYGKYQNDTMENIKMTPPITETTTEISTEISLTTQSEDKPLVVNTNKEIIESKTHLVLSKNQECKISKWDKDRLTKAIDIFIDEEGVYFSFLEKIYKDNKNFAPNTNGSCNKKPLTRFHNINDRTKNYTPEELEALLLENQERKLDKKDEQEKLNQVVEVEPIEDIAESDTPKFIPSFKPTWN